MLETCRNCNARVLFSNDFCPSCRRSRTSGEFHLEMKDPQPASPSIEEVVPTLPGTGDGTDSSESSSQPKQNRFVCETSRPAPSAMAVALFGVQHVLISLTPTSGEVICKGEFIEVQTSLSQVVARFRVSDVTRVALREVNPIVQMVVASLICGCLSYIVSLIATYRLQMKVNGSIGFFAGFALCVALFMRPKPHPYSYVLSFITASGVTEVVVSHETLPVARDVLKSVNIHVPEWSGKERENDAA